MSVVGFDFGNDSCYISVARQGGIENIANDYSMRSTPSFVAFSEKRRIMGVSAKSSHMTNVDKTFYGFKNLLGLMCDNPAVEDEKSRLPFPIYKEPNGTIGFRIDFCGKSKVLTPEQVTASLFTKLKEIAENALNTKINDVVISVPSFFNDSQRRALLDSAKMSGLNVLKLMNETTATALAYGIYKQDLPESDKAARNVIFVDCGQSSTQAAACSFNKGKLTILSSSHATIGGRNYDEAFANYFMDDFADKYKIDVRTNKKAKLKLLTEVEKIKKQMSTNTNKMPLNIECFMNDIDVKGVVDRAAFEEMIAPMIKQIEVTLEECLRTSDLKKEEIYSVEVVGGSSRIPCIKDAIERILGKVPSTTLNADEAISRGCALQCAILSPIFKIPEFSVTDVQSFPIKLVWGGPNAKKEDSGDMEVFPQFHAVPFSKMLTFYKSEPFTVIGEYAATVPFHSRHIGQFEIGEVRPTPEGGNQKVKVKINPSGIFLVSNAILVENHEVEDEVLVPMEVDGKAATETAPANGPKIDETMDTKDEQKDEGDEDKKPDEVGKEEMKVDETKTDEAQKDKAPVRMEKRKKIVNKTVDLPVTFIVLGSLMKERLDEATSIETAMTRQDINEQERLTAKNSFEEYIYEIRDEISDELEEFIAEDDRNKFILELEDAENWLYQCCHIPLFRGECPLSGFCGGDSPFLIHFVGGIPPFCKFSQFFLDFV